MKEITVEELQKLEMDKCFTDKVKNATSVQKLAEIMAEYGYELSVDEIRDGYSAAKKLLDQAKISGPDELSLEDLETVSGGINSVGFVFGAFTAMGVMASGPVGVALWLGGMAIMGGSLAC